MVTGRTSWTILLCPPANNHSKDKHRCLQLIRSSGNRPEDLIQTGRSRKHGRSKTGAIGRAPQSHQEALLPEDFRIIRNLVKAVEHSIINNGLKSQHRAKRARAKGAKVRKATKAKESIISSHRHGPQVQPNLLRRRQLRQRSQEPRPNCTRLCRCSKRKTIQNCRH